eukprot:2011802-Rhodomonas_salina.3
MMWYIKACGYPEDQSWDGSGGMGPGMSGGWQGMGGGRAWGSGMGGDRRSHGAGYEYEDDAPIGMGAATGAVIRGAVGAGATQGSLSGTAPSSGVRRSETARGTGSATTGGWSGRKRGRKRGPSARATTSGPAKTAQRRPRAFQGTAAQTAWRAKKTSTACRARASATWSATATPTDAVTRTSQGRACAFRGSRAQSVTASGATRTGSPGAEARARATTSGGSGATGTDASVMRDGTDTTVPRRVGRVGMASAARRATCARPTCTLRSARACALWKITARITAAAIPSIPKTRSLKGSQYACTSPPIRSPMAPLGSVRCFEGFAFDDCSYQRMVLSACAMNRFWYAVSGTDTAFDVICLRAFYAMSGTDIAYGAASVLLSRPVRCAWRVRGLASLSAYARATQSPVLTYRLGHTQY